MYTSTGNWHELRVMLVILDEVSKCFVMLWSGDKLLKFYIFNNNVVMEFDACCDSDIGTGKATGGRGSLLYSQN